MTLLVWIALPATVLVSAILLVSRKPLDRAHELKLSEFVAWVPRPDSAASAGTDSCRQA
jgi:hypothetical protein